MAVSAKVGVPVPIVMILDDGKETLHPRAFIFESGGTVPIDILDLEHKALGRYEASYTPTAVGVLSATFITFTDLAHMVESIVYTREVEQIFVTQSNVDDLAEAVVRLLGLNHENAFIDNTEFDVYEQLVSCRVRLFDSKANVEAATDGDTYSTGLIATYTMEAAHEGEGKLKTYRYVKQP
jgi:hypothetical protein